MYETIVRYFVSICSENDKCMEETIQTNVRCGTSSTDVWKGYMKCILIRKYEIFFFQ